jgi:hypothetical protein
MGIWVSVILGYTLTLIDSAVVFNQRTQLFMVNRGYSQLSLASTTNPLGQYFIIAGLTLQVWSGEAIFFVLVILWALLGYIFLNRGVPSGRSERVLSGLCLVGFLVILTVPFIIRWGEINSYWLPSDVNGSFISPPPNATSEIRDTVLESATQTASAIVFLTYFVLACNAILSVALLWASVMLRKRYRRCYWKLLSTVGFVLAVGFVLEMVPNLTFELVLYSWGFALYRPEFLPQIVNPINWALTFYILAAIVSWAVTIRRKLPG